MPDRSGSPLTVGITASRPSTETIHPDGTRGGDGNQPQAQPATSPYAAVGALANSKEPSSVTSESKRDEVEQLSTSDNITQIPAPTSGVGSALYARASFESATSPTPLRIPPQTKPPLAQEVVASVSLHDAVQEESEVDASKLEGVVVGASTDATVHDAPANASGESGGQGSPNGHDRRGRRSTTLI
eukprot:m.307484 g.307484  ORF g.307484 m.307484 type:complete len:187 (+) comp16362_c0_seq4:3635-4195(+)